MNKITIIYHHASPNAHCGAVAPHRDGVLVSYYLGPECTDAQTTIIEFWHDTTLIDKIVLPQKTGNAIIIPASIHKAYIIYSRFEDKGPNGEKPKNQVERWKYCSNWIAPVIFQDGRLQYGAARPFAPDHYGLLTRCASILHNDTHIVPMYDEINGSGELYSGSGQEYLKFRYIASISKPGHKMIQPTIWHADQCSYALMRNFGTGTKAYFSQNSGEGWSDPQLTNVDNFNSSIVAVHDGSINPLVIWNPDSYRSTLLLGRFDSSLKTATPYLVLAQSRRSSYPNYCWDQEGNLQIVHSSTSHLVRHIIPKSILSQLEEKALDKKKTLSLSDFKCDRYQGRSPFSPVCAVLSKI